MGCDIHLVTEIKLNGRWVGYEQPSIERNYGLFAKMAGVRNYKGVKPIALPRGLPEDCSELTLAMANYWDMDGHSFSYLTAHEIFELEEWWREIYKDQGWPKAWPERQWGFLFGNSWGSFFKYPKVRPDGVDDVRFVFWFDN